MAEYIEKDKAKELVCEFCTWVGTSNCEECEHPVDDVPAADVQPVRHGRWVKTIGENGVTSACRCNLCGFEDNRYSLLNYCPNCGAKMDGGKG